MNLKKKLLSALLAASFAGNVGAYELYNPKIVIGSQVLGGTANQVLFIGTGEVVDQSTLLTFDEANKRLTVGTGTGTSTGVQIGYAGTSGAWGLWRTGDTPGLTTAFINGSSGLVEVGSAAITSVYLTTPVAGTIYLFAGTQKVAQAGTAGAGPAITAGVSVDNTQRALSISGGWTDGTSNNIGVVINIDQGVTGTGTGKLFSLQAGAAGTTEKFSVSHLGSAIIVATTVALLNASPTIGEIANVNDATVVVAKGIAVTGGGAAVATVMWNGTNWVGI